MGRGLRPAQQARVYGEVWAGTLRPFVDAQVSRPANDRFANSQVLAGDAGSTFGDLTSATTEPGETLAHETSVWYSWTPSESGPAQVSAYQHSFDSTIRVYTGASIAALSEISFNDDVNGMLQSTVNFSATAGTTYRIAVDGFAFSFGDFTLSYAINPPANDNFASPTTLTGKQGFTGGTNERATGEPGELDSFGGDSSVWYSWMAPTSGTAVFTTAGSNFDTVLSAGTGSAITGLSTVTVNDDTNATLQSFISFPATSGVTYRLSLEGYFGDRGDFLLQWDTKPPNNDLFANPRTISGSSGANKASTVGAVGEPGEPAHHGGFNNGSVWYRWTAPASGNATFLADSGGRNDHVMAAYTGSAITALTFRASDDDSGPGFDPTFTFPVTAGTVYLVAVDPYSSLGGAGFTLRWHY